MPFILYQVDGSKTYRLLRTVSLAGTRGPLVRHMEETSPDCGPWHLRERRLLELLGTDDPSRHALVIDLKPRVDGNVSLYRLRNVWGYRGEGWAPLALQLEVLFADREEPDPDRFKQCFREPGKEGTLVHEFLYLGKNWNWGMVGRVNGALLWPDAFDYFVAEISRTRPEKQSKQP